MNISAIPTAKRFTVAALLSLALAGAHADPREAARGEVCVTNGEVRAERDGSYLIESGSSRAVVKRADDKYVGMVVEYLGPSRDTTQLESGKVVRQFGLKLAAQDSCNVVYVMWPVDATELTVLSKVNAGKSTHAQCGVKGYEKVEPATSKPVKPLEAGKPRKLEAVIRARMLTVKVDDEVVWRGDAGRRTAALFGYPGLRTDNVRVRFKWLVENETAEEQGRARPAVACNAVR